MTARVNGVGNNGSNNISKRNTLKEPLSDRITLIIFSVVLVLFALFCLLPFLLVLVSSFTDEMEILRHGYSLFPGKLSLDAYKYIFATDKIFKAYRVTIFVTVIGTAISMLLTVAMAYPLSLKSVRYRSALSFFVYFTMLFNSGLVPSYILISRYLHMKDSIWVLIIPGLLSPWWLLLMRNFLASLPVELSESAKIDGANDILILVRIILPLSLPAIASIGLFYALSYWNEWFRALLYIEKKDLYPLQYIIMYILRSTDFANTIAKEARIPVQTLLPSYTVRMATTIVTIGPIIFIYPFIQKYFVKGLTMGAVKG